MADAPVAMNFTSQVIQTLQGNAGQPGVCAWHISEVPASTTEGPSWRQNGLRQAARGAVS